MFAKFYTTKMSGNAKSLQKRFSKIRAGKSKTARLMAMIMTVAILAATLGGAVVMAAVGGDGLEYREKDEIYFLAGFKTNIDVELNTMPEWIKDITNDGKIEMQISRINLCEKNGAVSDCLMGTFKGDKGQSSLIGVGNNNEYRFYPQISAKVDERTFLLIIESDENYNTNALSVCFTTHTSNENTYFGTPFYKKNFINLNRNSLEYIGDFDKYQKEYKAKTPIANNFTYFEKTFKNKEVKGIDIKVIEANTSVIMLQSNITRSEPEYMKVMVRKQSDILYDNGFCLLKLSDVNGSSIALQPSTFYLSKFDSGEIYVVDTILMKSISNSERTVIYRQREYVTIP